MRSIKRIARATTTWLTGAGSMNDLTTLSDRDLRDVGLVREQIGNTSRFFLATLFSLTSPAGETGTLRTEGLGGVAAFPLEHRRLCLVPLAMNLPEGGFHGILTYRLSK